jgi:hypothetical protein
MLKHVLLVSKLTLPSFGTGCRCAMQISNPNH